MIALVLRGLFFLSAIFSRDQNGCLQQPLPDVISAQNGRSLAAIPHLGGLAHTYGIFTPLPLRSDIDMHLALSRIQTGQIWIGILDGSDPGISPGIMMVLSEGDVQNQVFVVRQLPQNSEMLRSPSVPAEADGYNIHLTISNGSVTFKINSMQTSSFPLSFANRQLFIGFRNQFGFNWLDAQISDLKISKK